MGKPFFDLERTITRHAVEQVATTAAWRRGAARATAAGSPRRLRARSSARWARATSPTSTAAATARLPVTQPASTSRPSPFTKETSVAPSALREDHSRKNAAALTT